MKRAKGLVGVLLVLCAMHYTLGGFSHGEQRRDLTSHHNILDEAYRAPTHSSLEAEGEEGDRHATHTGVMKEAHRLVLDGKGTHQQQGAHHASSVAPFFPASLSLLNETTPPSDASWLPSGTPSPYYCTSFDNASYMWLKPEREFARDIPLLSFQIEGCPAPVLMHNVYHFPTSIMAPPVLGRRAVRRYFVNPTSNKSSSSNRKMYQDYNIERPPLHTAQSALFVYDSYVWRSVVVTHEAPFTSCNTSNWFDSAESCPEQGAICVRHCLRSLCCTGFQMSNNATHRVCDLIGGRLDQTRSEARYPSTRRPIVLLAQRREFRPSLNSDAWRLTVTGGIEAKTLLATNHVFATSKGPSFLFPSGSSISVALHGRFGDLSFPWANGNLKVSVLASKDEVDAADVMYPSVDVASGYFDAAAPDLRQHVLSDVGGHRYRVLGEDVLVPMSSGSAAFDPNDLLQAAGQLSADDYVGRTLCFVVRAVDWNPGVDEHFSLGTPNILPAVACSLVVAPPQSFVASWVSPLASRRSAVSAQRLPVAVSTRQVLSGVSRDPDVCAPNLRNNECCLPPLALRLEDTNGRLSAPVAGATFSNLRTDAFYAPRVELALLQGNASNDLMMCVRVVAGYHVVLDEAARGYTRNLIVEVTCDEDRLRLWESALHVLWIEPRLNSVKVGEVAEVPVAALVACRALSIRAAIPHLPTSDHGRVVSSGGAADSPVAFSLRAAGQVDFLTVQLQLMAAFAPNSLVVLHLSTQWQIRLREWAQLRDLNRTGHPRTYLNPTRLAVPPSRAAHVHACNFKFLLQSNIDFSHVIIWASNEHLVRAGIEVYVKQFDMSHPGRVDPRDGVVYDNINVPLSWMTDDEHRLMHHHLWEFMPWDGVSQEHTLAATLRALHKPPEEEKTSNPRRGSFTARYPSHQVYLEGAFFSRAVAQEFVAITELLPPHLFCTASGQYANNEIIPFLLMRYRCKDASLADNDAHLRGGGGDGRNSRPVAVEASCGGRVSTMLWREFFYFGSEVTLQETRCSPFAVPFGWKRVKKGLYPLTLELQAIAADPVRRLRVRDAHEHCNMTLKAAALHRKRQRDHFLSRL